MSILLTQGLRIVAYRLDPGAEVRVEQVITD
jgi:hypothetical protein